MRVAIIEIGSRATRLLIVEFERDGKIQVLKTARKQIALGLAVASGSQAVTEAIAEVAKQCRIFEKEAKSWKVRTIACFGTEALRRIRAEKLFKLTSLKAIVLDADAEAAFAFWGAVKDPSIDARTGETFVVIDLGSGSVEIVAGLLNGEVPTVLRKRSISIGANHLVKIFRDLDHNVEAFTTEIEKVLNSADLPRPERLSKVILAGGVATKTAWLKIRDNPKDAYDDKRMNGPMITAKELEARVAELHSWERKDPIDAALFVEPRRVDLDELIQVISGNILFLCLLKKWEKTECQVTTHGPRFGVAHKLAKAAS
jgi:exopolyphosphatase/pppGpp-phosphohydrolase